MKKSLDYLNNNKQSWNNKTVVHLKSNFYDVEGFINGNSSLNDIEIALLGDLNVQWLPVLATVLSF